MKITSSAWSDDLKAFVRSWASEAAWLGDAEMIHPERWAPDGHPHLGVLFGSRLDNLPDRLSRGDLLKLAQAPSADPLTTFLAVMAWGHSGNGTGSSRVDRIVADPSAAASIAFILKEARAGRIREAFEAAHSSHRLLGLGTAFISKLLWAAGFGTASEFQPLIFDKLVEVALGEVIDPASGWLLNWNSQTVDWTHYRDYCELVRRMRDMYVPDARIDQVEHWLWITGGGGAWHHNAIRRNQRYPLP